ncbi:hypothetical protein JCGZ_01106 [Jatropha curcas]|uniref:Uncharacterized protein n=1 Tax=Jatropha curcas TaxID=180498 RepID=A0A067L5G9_JATCU|nr:hypothetical protein JCGZ_01106 [Jatropha curcas]
MQGHRPLFRPGGGGGGYGYGYGYGYGKREPGRLPGGQQPPQQPPPQYVDHNFAPPNANFYHQNLANALLQGFSPQQNLNNYFPVFQNPNFPFQNSFITLPQQFPNGLAQQHLQPSTFPQQQYLQPSTSAQQQHQQASLSQIPSSSIQNSTSQNPKEKEHADGVDDSVGKEQEDFAQKQQKQPQEIENLPPKNMKMLEQKQRFQHMPRHIPKQFKQQHKKKELERVDQAVEKAWQDFLAASESVETWKVSQAALLTLQVESWGSLGIHMQEVPSLHRLILVEGKINAFIHCFVAVRRITSLYDLEVAICEHEGIEQFEELGLGPLLRHPLILHYFLVNPNATEVFKITTEEIILTLHEYMSSSKDHEINIDDFLQFTAKKRSVKGKENLGVRIQGLGEARRSKYTTLKKCLKIINRKSEAKMLAKGSCNKRRQRPLFTSQKKDLDERFSAISERIESFASVHKDFRGKHIRFDSLDSEDEEGQSDDSKNEDKTTSSDEGSHLSLQNFCSTDRVSSCPYPSATEEMSRLGLKSEAGGQSSPVSCGSRLKKNNGSLKMKRKIEALSGNASAPSKLLKGDTGKHCIHPIENGDKTLENNESDFILSDNSMRMFITTWKDTCKECTVPEVFERMLKFYKPGDTKKAAGKRKKIKRIFYSYPCIGLINIAVTSIKYGILDSVYDTFQALTQHELPNTLSEYESIEVELDEKHTLVIPDHSPEQTHSLAGVTVEEILRKINRYYELDHSFEHNGKSLLEDKFISLKKLCSCEFWLVDQFGIGEFKTLGHGDFFTFLEKHASLLPSEIQKLLVGNICEKSPLEASLLQHELIVLVSQASNSLWQGETISKQMISALLVKQFPLLSFKIMENGSMEDFLRDVGNYKSNVISNCVVFSATLLGNNHIGDPNEEHVVESTSMKTDSVQKMTSFESATSKNAIEVLLGAPMLSDLSLWSHWDLIFAPSLGPLVGWLLSEVNTQELLCLVSKDGKVIRIDQSANADSFLEAALQRSSFQTAVQLLSLLSLAGGEKHVPSSLLKCYARHAFDAILKNHLENVEVQDNNNCSLPGKLVDGIANNLSGELHKNLIQMNQTVPAASRFILDCLGYLPSEFCGFAAGVLLSGMQSVTKDAPSAILCECNQKERIMLHEIGLSIGIVEWIDDYHKFCLNNAADISTSSEPAHLEPSGSVLSTGSRYLQNAVDVYTCGIELKIAHNEDAHNKDKNETSLTMQHAIVSSDGISNGCTEESSELNKQTEAALVIESIRRDEFGLDPNLSCTESNILRKQHARLGRALHCLSQELYSEDSHFLLELVQNADDNVYPESVEPTLTFILQESGIVVLNNERGFSSQNVRALCDVGNSTKKGSGTGYIGKKGIGFKSVFRVTDAPEIHSNGFHIKFDISEGQIGFVLPTVVPPCNVGLFSRLLSRETGQTDKNCWNTCIALPFRSKLSEKTAMRMFSDLHPSLLLFLHKLQCIMFLNTLNNSLLVMRKEILPDGIVKVSCGRDKMSWLVASQKLQAHASRPTVQTTEIAIAFTLEELDNGDYHPCLDQQPVFSFLPLRTYGLKFILQGDFVLPSSREEVDKNDPWNEWLLTKFPGLFVRAERSFCTLSCFRENPGKAVAAYMSFVPLVGEVHGFFSGLPKAIALELRRTSCLFLEGDSCKMVPPCSVLRGWNEQARNLLPDSLLQEHLGLGFLDKNIVLSDSLAKALGIADYGPEILIKFMTCLCRTESGLKLMSLSWLSSFLNALYTMLSHSSGPTDLIDNLRHIPFIPLSDGTYSSVDKGTIWLHSNIFRAGLDDAQELDAFPQLYAKLRTVNSGLFSASAVDGTSVDNSARMLQKIGVQQLSAHEIVKIHILPAISDDRITNRDRGLMTDYLCFVMIHLRSSCPHCCVERMHIISELRNKAYILTNLGYRRPAETSIHFSKEFGSLINISKLINALDMKWHEVDITYLKHPINDSLSNALMMWRSFFQEIGVTDFVQVVQIEKCISDLCHTVLNDITWDKELSSPGSLASDWESFELMQMLSLLSKTSDRERCMYLLEVLDKMWDDDFSDKTTGHCNLKSSAGGRTFKSSFLSSIHDVPWIASSMDNELHYPKSLFYDCDAIRSILGASAPYALPKVRSTKLLSDIGFKTKVTLDDALEILRIWRESETSFKASVAQMSRFYTFIWAEMAVSKNKIFEALHSVPFIFIPFESGLRHEDMVSGIFLSSEEVHWHDPTGLVDHMKGINPQCGSTRGPRWPLSKTLCSVYAGLHDFFVKECGVYETPSCHSYFDILLQLSAVALPSQVASAVSQIFFKWADGLKSGLLSSDDIIHMKERLLKVEYTVLPTVQDKWVSLHSSFGLVCWCDDRNLKGIFEDLDNIDSLHFVNLNDEEKKLQTDISDIMHKLGIPALSKIITREAIYYGPADSSFKASLINWALPYAQRYMYSIHPDKYLQLKQSGFHDIKQLKVTVVEKLFYRNAIKGIGSSSNKRYECSCLLQGNTFYTASQSDINDVFLELSRLFFDGASDRSLANFLLLITTVMESGASEDQTELFIVNSQKVPKLPDDEPTWSLSSISPLPKDDKSFNLGVGSAANEQKSSKFKRKMGTSSNWPFGDWRTAPVTDYARANDFNTQALVTQLNGSGMDDEDDSQDIEIETATSEPIEIDTDWTIEENVQLSISPESENMDHHFVHASSQTLNMDIAADTVDLPLVSDGHEVVKSRFAQREKLNTRKVDAKQIQLTGRLGERVAFKYLTEKFGERVVKWVNEDNETGLPYDIVMEENGNGREYFEVKATRSTRKDWFEITVREWQFAVEKGDSFSIAHVVLQHNNTARVTIFQNPVKQCQAGKLRLALLMQK